ncbi:MAG: YebC/PmpR family DNA-binding transcriptional regulator [Cytophagia bacterium]|jgi:YebC/PmpR family DNA-binding regulatory protein|nr:YebC/PmpR family DNA-binding transcriptional regulator [Cytophagia bacterium]
MGRAFEYRKARKFARWDKMSKTFTRIGREIAMSVKAGGPEPESNTRLRAAIQNAKAANMPKDRVEAAIKKASNKDEKAYEEVIYEGYAPHGIAVLVETATDNPTRTVANVRHIFSKYGGSMGTSGSVGFLFERKATFRLDPGDRPADELELELIDAGAEDVQVEDGEWTLTAAFANYGLVQKSLENLGIQIISSELAYIPTMTKSLDESQAEECIRLMDMLEEDDDVQNVYCTLA